MTKKVLFLVLLVSLAACNTFQSVATKSEMDAANNKFWSCLDNQLKILDDGTTEPLTLAISVSHKCANERMERRTVDLKGRSEAYRKGYDSGGNMKFVPELTNMILANRQAAAKKTIDTGIQVPEELGDERIEKIGLVAKCTSKDITKSELEILFKQSGAVQYEHMAEKAKKCGLALETINPTEFEYFQRIYMMAIMDRLYPPQS